MVDEIVADTPKQEMSSIDLLTELRGEREKMDKAVETMKKLSSEQNEINTRMIMGGTARAGTAPVKEKTSEQLAEEEAEKTVKRLFGR